MSNPSRAGDCQTGTKLRVGFILLLTVVIPGCRPQQAQLERRWLPGVYLCEARDQTEVDGVRRADGGERTRQMRITVTEVAELTVREADSSGTKRLEWRPRRMVVVRDGAVCDSESEAATPRCFAPRALVKTVYAGHVNPDGTVTDDGIAAGDGNSEKMWSAFRSWMTPEAEWQIVMGDLRRVLTFNYGPLNHLPHVVSTGDRWSSSSTFSAPAFGGVVEAAFRHEVARIDRAPGGQTVTIVSTSTGGFSGRDVALGRFSGNVKNASLRSAGVFDVSLGMVTSTNNSASGEIDVDFGLGVTGTLEYRYESSTACRKAGE